jgi:hypothetical protein
MVNFKAKILIRIDGVNSTDVYLLRRNVLKLSTQFAANSNMDFKIQCFMDHISKIKFND